MKKLFLLTVSLLIPILCYATPTINTAVKTNNTISIEGVSFGNKQVATPYKWDNFEDGIVDNIFTGSANVSINTTENRSGSNYCVAKDHVNAGTGISISNNNTYDGYYTYFWAKVPSDVVFGSLGQIKHVRMYTKDDSFPYPNFTLSKHWFSETDRSFITTIEDTPPSTWIGGDDLYDDGNWHLIECWFKPSSGIGNTDGEIKVKFDGVVYQDSNNIQTDDDGSNNFDTLWGVFNYYKDADKDAYIDDVYYDYTQARVMIGNNQDFNESTHLEIQIPTAWSDNSITVTYNQGSFKPYDSVYLFVIDENGNASNGYKIQLKPHKEVSGNVGITGGGEIK